MHVITVKLAARAGDVAQRCVKIGHRGQRELIMSVTDGAGDVAVVTLTRDDCDDIAQALTKWWP